MGYIPTKFGLAALVAIVSAAACGGCASIGTPYTTFRIESELELVFSHKYKELVLIRADGERATSLFRSTTSIITPRFSPDGNTIAFYDLGASSGRPVSSTNVSLVFGRLDHDGEFELVSFPLTQFDTDHRLIVDDVIPPLWEPEGRSVLISHNSGIERVTISGERFQLVSGGRITAISLSRGGGRVIYSDGQNIFFIDRGGGTPRAVLEPDFVPAFGNVYIGAMAVSPKGDSLAFSMGNTLFVLEISSLELSRIFEAGNRIYWVDWVPGTDQILVLSGREKRTRGSVSAWMYDVAGKYRLVSITSDGEMLRELFSEHWIDARLALPNLSPDGRYVSLTARNGRLKEIVLVATDGSTVSLLTAEGPNSYASWRPISNSRP